jgi:outer membrane protein OmpA-like peptidoglycan-associated protein
MTTLLLTFFVMLLSLAAVRDEKLFGVSRKSFLEALKGFGLGVLYGEKNRIDFGNAKIKHFIIPPDRQVEDRSIDAKEERLRRIFKDLSRSMQIVPSQVAAKRANFSVTNIRFARGESRLDKPARRFLTAFCRDLEQAPDSKTARLCVLGLAADETTEREQWIVSARRAQAVADFLKDSSKSGWAVYSWGAGPGGDWVEQDSPVFKQSHILIAILRADN